MDIPTLASCLNIVIHIILAFATLAAAIALIYTAGCSLGYPFGQLLLPYIQQVIPDTRKTQTHDQRASPQPESSKDQGRNFSEDKLARVIGAMIAFFFSFTALMIELFLEGQKDITGEANGWDLWRMSAVLMRVCVEGLLTLVILRAIRYFVLKISR
jgi:hypothetical protein